MKQEIHSNQANLKMFNNIKFAESHRGGVTGLIAESQFQVNS